MKTILLFNEDKFVTSTRQVESDAEAMRFFATIGATLYAEKGRVSLWTFTSNGIELKAMMKS